jgi:serine/threonine-protein kinase
MGTVIAERYEVESLIAQGGFGRVFLARHVRLGSRVAVKLLKPVPSDSERLRKRFLREARTVAALDHPHIVRIHDLGEIEGGTLYVAMEYLDGVPLTGPLRSGALSPQRLVRILGAAARALDYAHAKGVVHRDIKPPNIMVLHHGDEPDYVKLIDFGIVKRFEDAEGAHDVTDTLTAAQSLVGTPAYMAPEQARRAAVGPATDQYALAVVAYEGLVGHRPFRGGSHLELVGHHLHSKPPPIRSFRDGSPAPAAVDAAIQKALAKRPADRYATVRDFVDALELALSEADRDATRRLEPRPPPPPPLPLALDETVSAPPPATPTALDASPPRRRLVASIALGVSATGLLALGWALWPEVPAAPDASVAAPPALEVAAPSAPEAPGNAPEDAVEGAEVAEAAAIAMPPVQEADLAMEVIDLVDEAQEPAPDPASPAPDAASEAPDVASEAPDVASEAPDAAVAPEPAPAAGSEERRPATSARPSEPVGTAKLSVNTIPMAVVTIDGRSHGDGGFFGLETRAGKRRVVAVTHDGRKHTEFVRLRAGRSYLLTLDFDKGAHTLKELR